MGDQWFQNRLRLGKRQRLFEDEPRRHVDFFLDDDEDYRNNWPNRQHDLFFMPGNHSKIWYKSPAMAEQLRTASGERYPKRTFTDPEPTIYHISEMSAPMQDLYTYMGSFNQTQRGEVVEAFGHVLLRNYLAHGNDDYIVDGYHKDYTINDQIVKRRLLQLRLMSKNGRNLGRIADRMKLLYDANLRGVFEPRHNYLRNVPVEIKCRSGDKGTNDPSLGQAIYLWIFQGILLHVRREDGNESLYVEKIHFYNINADEFADYVDSFI